jgi:hypothetical protein
MTTNEWLEPQKSIDNKRHFAISDTLYSEWGGLIFELYTQLATELYY